MLDNTDNGGDATGSTVGQRSSPMKRRKAACRKSRAGHIKLKERMVMELRHIAIELIHDTKLNMRHDRKPPDVSDILPTVKAKGILQPLLVRPYAEAGEAAASRTAP
jgi:ParB family chromosome partitioning protein